jgi:hypothetical protein
MFQVLRFIICLLIYQEILSLSPLINGLLDHDARLLKLENIVALIQEFAS